MAVIFKIEKSRYLVNGFTDRHEIDTVTHFGSHQAVYLFILGRIASYAAYCYRASSVVCQSVTLVSPAKTAQPIDMPFGLMMRVAQGTTKTLAKYAV